MIYSKQNTDIYTLMKQGKEVAIRTGKQCLVSSVLSVNKMDLPGFFLSQKERYVGDRFFWSEPYRTLSFVGLGSVLRFEAVDVQQRFQQVEREWHEVLGNCLVEEDAPAHTGPLLFGGFSFDPFMGQSALWQDFSHTSFAVPQYMVTQVQDQAWLTTNVLLSPDPEELEYLNMVELDLNEFILSQSEAPASSGKIIKEEFAPSDWMKSVGEAASSIRKGFLEKVVLARHIGLKAEHDFQLEQILSKLLAEQANTYVFAIDHGNSCFVGATPERLIKRTGNEFLTLSLAGSIARGRTTEEDDQLGHFLIKDVKNLHEHALAVQMIKGAMTELCEQVDAPDAPILRKLKDIQHLATPISGQAREGASLLKAVATLHPTPALGGMPVQAAIEAIRKLENMDRGWYAAPIGWINRHQDGEFVAAIRSALVQGKEAVLFAGCGIVGDSDPISEFHETALKFRPMLTALQALDHDVNDV